VATLLKATLPPNVRVQTELVHGVCVLGDASQLHQVVMNLGINASQAMQPGGGRLSIRLSPVEPGPPAGGAGAQICLTVEDSGCGMDESTLERIFEPFFTTKALGQGTGLGLSVVHGIVQGHGGRLEVHSRPGLGTSFHIFLPRHQERRQGDGDRGSTVSRIEPFEARETSWGPPPGGSTLGTG
jgi:two-component system cell cycle sensor histidine kinase/response regulator CckA